MLSSGTRRTISTASSSRRVVGMSCGHASCFESGEDARGCASWKDCVGDAILTSPPQRTVFKKAAC
jgi:hypothetical protein